MLAGVVFRRGRVGHREQVIVHVAASLGTAQKMREALLPSRGLLVLFEILLQGELRWGLSLLQNKTGINRELVMVT